MEWQTDFMLAMPCRWSRQRDPPMAGSPPGMLPSTPGQRAESAGSEGDPLQGLIPQAGVSSKVHGEHDVMRLHHLQRSGPLAASQPSRQSAKLPMVLAYL